MVFRSRLAGGSFRKIRGGLFYPSIKLDLLSVEEPLDHTAESEAGLGYAETSFVSGFL